MVTRRCRRSGSQSPRDPRPCAWAVIVNNIAPTLSCNSTARRRRSSWTATSARWRARSATRAARTSSAPFGERLDRAVTEVSRSAVGAVKDAEHAFPHHHGHRDHSPQPFMPHLRVELVGDRPGGAVIADAVQPTRRENLTAQTLTCPHHDPAEAPGARAHERAQDDLIVIGRHAYEGDVEPHLLPDVLDHATVGGVFIEHRQDVAILGIELGQEAESLCHLGPQSRCPASSDAPRHSPFLFPACPAANLRREISWRDGSVKRGPWALERLGITHRWPHPDGGVRLGLLADAKLSFRLHAEARAVHFTRGGASMNKDDTMRSRPSEWSGVLAVAALAAGVFLGGIAVAASNHGAPKLELVSLSAHPARVSGGDVLVQLNVPAGARVDQVVVSLNGRNVTTSFRPGPASGSLVGLVTGLAVGRNTLTAYTTVNSGTAPARLELVNHPLTGPILSGPHQTPFICETASFVLPVTGAVLGPPLDADCSVATRIDYVYRSTDGTRKPLSNPAVHPADLAQTTTTDARTVNYIVRVETGTVNRAIYQIAMLHDPVTDPTPDLWTTSPGWNGRLLYSYGGGAKAGYHQGRTTGGVRQQRQRRSLRRDDDDGQGALHRALRSAALHPGHGQLGGLDAASLDQPE